MHCILAYMNSGTHYCEEPKMNKNDNFLNRYW